MISDCLIYGVQMVNSCLGLLRNSHKRIDNFVPLICLSNLWLALDNGLENIELIIFRGSGVRDSTILEEQVFHLLTFVDEKIYVRGELLVLNAREMFC